MDAKRPTPRHIIIKVPKFEDKERILKAAREKKLFTYRGISMKLFAFFNEFFLIFHIFDILFSSPLDIYLEMGMVEHMVVLFLIF